MEGENSPWNGNDGGEGRAGERLSGRSARFVEKLMEKLARHNRDAEHLAEAMHNTHEP